MSISLGLGLGLEGTERGSSLWPVRALVSNPVPWAEPESAGDLTQPLGPQVPDVIGGCSVHRKCSKVCCGPSVWVGGLWKLGWGVSERKEEAARRPLFLSFLSVHVHGTFCDISVSVIGSGQDPSISSLSDGVRCPGSHPWFPTPNPHRHCPRPSLSPSRCPTTACQYISSGHLPTWMTALLDCTLRARLSTAYISAGCSINAWHRTPSPGKSGHPRRK